MRDVMLPGWNIPVKLTILVMGAGDVFFKKLVPAFLYLYLLGRDPEGKGDGKPGRLDEFAVISVAGMKDHETGRERSDEWIREKVRDTIVQDPYFNGLMEVMGVEEDERVLTPELLRAFCESFHFYGGRLNRASEIAHLTGHVEERKVGENLLLILATPPDTFPRFVADFGQSLLFSKTGPFPGFRRGAVEKPFGVFPWETASLNLSAARHFGEKNTFRIEHFLGYYMNMALQRYPLAKLLSDSPRAQEWTWSAIQCAQCVASEGIAVEPFRVPFYEAILGEPADKLQHVMMMGAAATMALTREEEKGVLDSSWVQEARAAVFGHLRIHEPDLVYLGRYRSYRETAQKEMKGVSDLRVATHFSVPTRVHALNRDLPMVMSSMKAGGLSGQPKKFTGTILKRGDGLGSEWLQLVVAPQIGIWHAGKRRDGTVELTNVTGPEFRDFLREPVPAAMPYAAMLNGMLDGVESETLGADECAKTGEMVHKVVEMQMERPHGRLKIYGDHTPGPDAASFALNGVDAVRMYGVGDLPESLAD